MPRYRVTDVLGNLAGFQCDGGQLKEEETRDGEHARHRARTLASTTGHTWILFRLEETYASPGMPQREWIELDRYRGSP